MTRITLALPAPYVGLRPFDEADALLFFGRDRHVADLLAKMRRRQRFVAVLGASGTGKSSLVRAGLVPALRSGALNGTPNGAPDGAAAVLRWNICVFTPGDAPLTRLARALLADARWMDGGNPADAEAALAAQLGSSPLALANLVRQRAAQFAGEALLLVVDQFEEIFRFRQAQVDEADSFVKLLLRTASEDLPVHVVTTMRSDFLGHAVAIRGLAEAINDGLYLVPRPGFDAVRSAICSPLALAGGSIDAALANRLLNALRGDDELPVLQHAMLRMWNRARAEGRRAITEADFLAVCASPAAPGGQAPGDGAPVADLAAAIDRHADTILADLPQDARDAAPRVFLCLAERSGGRDVRRPQTVAELVAQVGAGRRAAALAVVDAFRARDAGFLQPGAAVALQDGTVLDISHESLIRQWRQFQAWLRDEETDIAGLREWQLRALRHAQDGAGLLNAADAARAQRWRQRVSDGRDALRWTERHLDAGSAIDAAGVLAYLDDSQAAQAAALRRKRGARRIRWTAVLLMPVLAWLVTPLFGGPAMPDRLVFAVPNINGADADLAQDLGVAGRRVGITINLRAAGEEGLAGLVAAAGGSSGGEPDGGVDLAFVRSGQFDRREWPGLVTLGNMYLRPVWLFYRLDAPVVTLADLSQRKLGLTGAAKDPASIERALLALNGVDLKALSPTYDGGTQLTIGLVRGELQAIILQAPTSSVLVQSLLRTPGIALFNDRRARFHATSLRDLTQVTLPAGTVDGRFPAEDVNLLAATMALVARADLPDEMVALLLAEAGQLFKGKGLLHEAGTFPNGRASSDSELPLATAAADYYRSGPPLLLRWLPFRLAALLPRMVPALLVVVLLVIPLLVLAPRVHDAAGWLVRRLRRGRTPGGVAEGAALR